MFRNSLALAAISSYPVWGANLAAFGLTLTGVENGVKFFGIALAAGYTLYRFVREITKDIAIKRLAQKEAERKKLRRDRRRKTRRAHKA